MICSMEQIILPEVVQQHIRVEQRECPDRRDSQHQFAVGRSDEIHNLFIALAASHVLVAALVPLESGHVPALVGCHGDKTCLTRNTSIIVPNPYKQIFF